MFRRLLRGRDELHRDVGDAIHFVRIVDRDEVRMRTPGGETSFLPESADRLRIDDLSRPDQLDCIDPAEHTVPGAEHLAHTADADAVEQDILPQNQPGPVPGSELFGLEWREDRSRD